MAGNIFMKMFMLLLGCAVAGVSACRVL